MKRTTVTVRIDSDLKPLLDRACRRSRRTRSEIVRDALRRHLKLLEFEHLRRRTIPHAETHGYLTDEDVFRDVS
jgi:predicted transcriptional regulator